MSCTIDDCLLPSSVVNGQSSVIGFIEFFQ